MFICVLIYASLTVFETNAYVLLQVRNNKNQSNIDALIHRVVPAIKTENIVKQMTNNHNNARKSRHHDSTSGDTQLEAFMINIDTGSKRKQDPETKASNIMKFIEKAILDYAKNNPSPIYRSRDGNAIKPEIVQMRDGKPSVIFNVNFGLILNILYDILTSKIASNSVKSLAKQAAVAFRAFKEEMGKNKKRGY